MSEIKIINGQSLPNIPWQERPADLEEGAVLWRYTENPVMGRNPTPKIGRIFNSAVCRGRMGISPCCAASRSMACRMCIWDAPRTAYTGM